MRYLRAVGKFLLGFVVSRFLHGSLAIAVMMLLPLLRPVPPPSLEPLPLGDRELITQTEKAFLLASFLIPAIPAWLVRNRWRAYAYGCAAYVVIEFFRMCYLLATHDFQYGHWVPA